MATFVVKDKSGKEFKVSAEKINEAENDGFLPVVTDGKKEFRVPFQKLAEAEKDGFKPRSVEPDYTIEQGVKDFIDAATNKEAQLAYGAAAGGALGFPLGPLGIAGGAALGAGLVKSAQNIGQQKTTKELFQEPAVEMARGAAMEMGGQLASKGLSKAAGLVEKGARKAAEIIRPTVVKQNAQQIIDAGKTLGLEITPAMLDDSSNSLVQRLESHLAKSPSFAGKSVAEKQKTIYEGLQTAVEGVTKEQTTLTPFQVGEKAKSGMVASVGEKLDAPVSKFENVLSSTQNIPVEERLSERLVKSIEKIPAYRLTGGAGKPSKYIEMIRNAQNADDVKVITTMINRDLSPDNKALDSTEKFVLGEMKDKISRFEQSTIMRSAVQQAKDAGMRQSTGKKIGSEIVQELKTARKEYREVSKELSDVAKDAGLKVKNPRAFVDEVERLPSEKIQEKFFNTENNRLLMNLKKSFPDEFELLKQGKIKEIAESSVNNTAAGQGEISAQKFMNEIRKLNPEAQQMLFSEEALKTISAIDTINKAIPKNFNPSGTANAQQIADIVMTNIKDIPLYLIYKGASSNVAANAAQVTKNLGQVLKKAPNLADLAFVNPKFFNEVVSLVAKQAVQEKTQTMQQKPNKFPVIVRKNGMKTTIMNQKELDEARLEGWR